MQFLTTARYNKTFNPGAEFAFIIARYRLAHRLMCSKCTVMNGTDIPTKCGIAEAIKKALQIAMASKGPNPKQKQDGSMWLPISAENPLRSAATKVEVKQERQRWMAAPGYSRNRFLAKPAQKEIGVLRALRVLLRKRLRPRDDFADRLSDIEQLIVAGHNDAADEQIGRLRTDYPFDATRARLLGLISLNLYDRGNEDEAQIMHEYALLFDAAHPAMVEIFGNEIRSPDYRKSKGHPPI